MNVKRQLKKVLPQPVAKALRRIIPTSRPGAFTPFQQSGAAREIAKNRFAQIQWPSSSDPCVIYALTPTAGLRNVGDQAQAVAIRRWLGRHYPSFEIVELDKDIVLACIDDIKANVTPRDLIFLHSGGNLGDRGRWSEAARRAMISTFPDNRIVSLPQTIFFSDTPRGRHERELTREIYGRHQHLTVIGRDEVSGRLAADLFPRAQVSILPDFVLSLQADDFALCPDPRSVNQIMACLRLDDESVFDQAQRSALADRLGQPTTLFDTTLSRDIAESDRVGVLQETLELFSGHEAVVTDRFHGLIFSVLCRKPTVVLPTVDHKLTSAVQWFSDIPNVQLCHDVDRLPEVLEKVRAISVDKYPDFNQLYFDRLPQLIANGTMKPASQ